MIHHHHNETKEQITRHFQVIIFTSDKRVSKDSQTEQTKRYALSYRNANNYGIEPQIGLSG